MTVPKPPGARTRKHHGLHGEQLTKAKAELVKLAEPVFSGPVEVKAYKCQPMERVIAWQNYSLPYHRRRNAAEEGRGLVLHSFALRYGPDLSKETIAYIKLAKGLHPLRKPESRAATLEAIAAALNRAQPREPRPPALPWTLRDVEGEHHDTLWTSGEA